MPTRKLPTYIILLFTSLLFFLLQEKESWGQNANPYLTAIAPLPEGRGIDYFYGRWAPLNQYHLALFDEMAISKEVITHNRTIPKVVYKVIKTYKDAVLIISELPPPEEEREEDSFYFYEMIYREPSEIDSFRKGFFKSIFIETIRINRYRCTPDPEELALIKKYFRHSSEGLYENTYTKSKTCNPRLNGATMEAPWGGKWQGFGFAGYTTPKNYDGPYPSPYMTPKKKKQ